MNIPAVYNILSYLRSRLNARRKLTNEPATSDKFSNLTNTIDQLTKENISLKFKNEQLRHQIELMSPIISLAVTAVDTKKKPNYGELEAAVRELHPTTQLDDEEPLWV